MLVVALVAMTSCSDNEDNTVREAQDALYEAVSEHWFAELPVSGETDNCRHRVEELQGRLDG